MRNEEYYIFLEIIKLKLIVKKLGNYVFIEIK